MKKSQPLISCLCVTHKKPHLLKRAIKCFNYQTYRNKQLIIVYEEADKLTSDFLESTVFPQIIKIIKIDDNDRKLSLGELRNLSVQNADGEYICQWDDDDWYSEDRLEVQMEYIEKNKKPASILLRWIIFDSINKKSYLSPVRAWEGSILCLKSLLTDYPYPALPKKEDSPVIYDLVMDEHVILIDEPEIYIYNYHGSNTWEDFHFETMIYESFELPEETNKEVIKCMNINDW